MPVGKAKQSVLFHPKRPVAKKPQPNGTATTTSKASAPPPSSVKEDDADPFSKLPPGNADFNEFRLLSSASNGWKYDVMKFKSTNRVVDVMNWQPPVKLNRKDPYRDGVAGPSERVPVAPFLGSDGKEVIGENGQKIMADAQGRPIHPSSSEKSAKGRPPTKKRNQKKTKQIFLVPEETRQLRREERYSWVLEDGTGEEKWVAQLDDINKSSMHAFFMPDSGGTFRFVPANRWYTLSQKKRNGPAFASTEEMESRVRIVSSTCSSSHSHVRR